METWLGLLEVGSWYRWEDVADGCVRGRKRGARADARPDVGPDDTDPVQEVWCEWRRWFRLAPRAAGVTHDAVMRRVLEHAPLPVAGFDFESS